ncbi:hypothetical protein [Streptomyces sparsogenes]|uniref:hypothetical protein n=1 Tax=Streptomyces sparsogenes TaxID=67365 RepID=UPI0033F97977
MADDHRYSWLDDDAAERLLRGEPAWAGPSDSDGGGNGRSDRSREEAERLAAVLGAVAEASRPAAGGAADGQAALPGEEAAVAAFRAARAEQAERAQRAGRTGRTVRGARLGTGGGSDTHGVFRMARPSGEPGGQARLRRPLHMGLVAALAGCALSGFAVATAAGVLPFGRHDGAPGPTVSMPAGGTTGERSAAPRISPDGGTPPGTGGSADHDAGGGVSRGGDGSRTSPGQGAGDDGTDTDDDKSQDKGQDKGKGADDSASQGSPGTSGNGWAVTLCRQYLAAESGDAAAIDAKDLRKLEKAAGSPTAIHGYCAAVVDDGGEGTPRSGGDSGDNGGNSGGQGGDSGNSGQGDDGTGPGKEDGGTGTDGVPAPPPPPPPSDPVTPDADPVTPDTDGVTPDTGPVAPTATGAASTAAATTAAAGDTARNGIRNPGVTFFSRVTL